MKHWITFFIALLFMVTVTHAGDVTLTWEGPDNATKVTGYRLYSGSVSKTYTDDIDVGLVTTGTVKNIPRGTLTYFAVKAYGAEGELSDFSNEVSVLVPLPLIDSPNIHQVILTFNTQKAVSTSVVKSQRKKPKR